MYLRPSFAFVWLALGAGCGGAAQTAEEEGSSALTVPCVAAESRHVEDTREVTGVVDTPPDRRAMVAAEIAGRVRSIAVREGDVVVAGQLLAEVDPGAATDASSVSRAHVVEITFAVDQARATRDRAQQLVSRGIAARHELDDASSRFAELGATLAAARATAHEASRVVGRTRVLAPLDGVVVRVMRHPGETVDGTPNTPLLEIADTRTLEVALSMAARDLLALRVGQLAHVAVDGLDAPLEAAVVRVSPALDPVSGIGAARLALPAREPALPLGLAAHASIVVGAHDAIVVPSAAIRGRRDGANEVLVCDHGAARAQEVTTGAHLGDVTEVRAGLQGGTRVVAHALGIDEGTATGTPR